MSCHLVCLQGSLRDVTLQPFFPVMLSARLRLVSLQVWEDITQHLAQRDAEIVLLVHRLDKLEPERVSRKVQGSFNVMTGITSASEHEGLASIAELLTTGTAKADFSGRVGDCCDEDVVSQVNASTCTEKAGFSTEDLSFWVYEAKTFATLQACEYPCHLYADVAPKDSGK